MTTLVDSEIEELCGHDPAMLSPFSANKHKGPPSWGLGSAGYDVRLGQHFITFNGKRALHPKHVGDEDIIRLSEKRLLAPGEFVLAETMETFNMPGDIYATVHDKSSWIRLGLSVHNTVIEPGWRGVLTLELKNINNESWIDLGGGDGIAQVMFHRLGKWPRMTYKGQYQGQKGVTLPGDNQAGGLIRAEEGRRRLVTADRPGGGV